MDTKTLPKFEGKPLIEIPEIVPVTDFLTKDFGKAALAEYQGRAKADYKGNSILDVLSFQDEVVKGSNPFAVVLMNQVLSKEGIRVATPNDLGRILRTNALDLKGKYEDAALVLRSADNPNAYLARKLEEQLKARDKVKYPVMVPLASLELVNDQGSDYGLAFRLKEDAEVIHAPQLAHKNNNRKFSETDEQGLPVFDDDGSRTLYTKESGLSRLYLDKDLDLDSDWGDLDNSDSVGRVVVLSGATGNDLKEDLTARLNEQYTAREERLKAEKARLLGEIERLGQ